MIYQTDPRANYLSYQVEIDESIRRVLNSGHYILGEEVKSFENEFAAYLGADFALGTGNGTDALHLALRTIGISCGDVVVTVAHTAVPTVAAIEMAGATPLLIDIDPDTFTMSPVCLEQTLEEWGKKDLIKIKAIIPVHLYGHPADMTSIIDIGRRYNLFVIEDCAQAHGAHLLNQKVGTWGDIAAFSFYPTKNLGAIGDGGAIVTNNHELFEKAKMIREYGWKDRISQIPGVNTRLDEIQAAILRIKLKYLDKDNSRRREIASTYSKNIKAKDISLPGTRKDFWHVYHQFVIRTSNRNKLKNHLHQHNINTAIHYPIPVHLQPAYAGRVPLSGNLGQTEAIVNEILSLPIYPELAESQVHDIVNCINRFDAQNLN